MAVLTVHALLSKAASENGDGLALSVPGGAKLTHSELQEAIEKAAIGLKGAGVKAGDLVSLAFPNSLEVWETPPLDLKKECVQLHATLGVD